MGKKISANQLSGAVMEELEEYAQMVSDDMKAAVKNAGNTARKEISASAPKDTGAYAKSWAVKKTKESSNELQVTVHSKIGIRLPIFWNMAMQNEVAAE